MIEIKAQVRYFSTQTSKKGNEYTMMCCKVLHNPGCSVFDGFGIDMYSNKWVEENIKVGDIVMLQCQLTSSFGRLVLEAKDCYKLEGDDA